MRAQSDPRRVYSRNAVTHVLYGGVAFGPGKEGTSVNVEREVRIAVLDPAGGRKRVEVTQRVGQRTVKETWRQVTVPVTHRTA